MECPALLGDPHLDGCAAGMPLAGCGAARPALGRRRAAARVWQTTGLKPQSSHAASCQRRARLPGIMQHGRLLLPWAGWEPAGAAPAGFRGGGAGLVPSWVKTARVEVGEAGGDRRGFRVAGGSLPGGSRQARRSQVGVCRVAPGWLEGGWWRFPGGSRQARRSQVGVCRVAPGWLEGGWWRFPGGSRSARRSQAGVFQVAPGSLPGAAFFWLSRAGAPGHRAVARGGEPGWGADSGVTAPGCTGGSGEREGVFGAAQGAVDEGGGLQIDGAGEAGGGL